MANNSPYEPTPSARTETLTKAYTLIAKFGKDRIELGPLSPCTTIGDVKTILSERTGVLPKRQKFIGLSLKPGSTFAEASNGSVPPDKAPISDLRVKAAGKKGATNGNDVTHQFILMGTPGEFLIVRQTSKSSLQIRD